MVNAHNSSASMNAAAAATTTEQNTFNHSDPIETRGKCVGSNNISSHYQG